MRQIVRLVILVVISSSSFTGCASYMANQCNTPLLGEAREGKISAGFSIIPSAEFQAAYAPINHLGVIASYLLPTDSKSDSIPEVENLWEIGAGYFNTIGSNGWRYGLYGGYGKGKGSNGFNTGGGALLGPPEDEDHHNISFKYTQYFAQGEIGFVRGWFDGGVASRLLRVRMSTYLDHVIHDSVDGNFETHLAQSSTISNTPDQTTFLQEAFFIRSGSFMLGDGSGFKIGFEMWFMQALSHNSFSFYPFNLTFGVSWRFNFPQ